MVKEKSAEKTKKQESGMTLLKSDSQKEIAQPLKVKAILDKLDDVYGITKTGFFHQEPWQLLVAIMLSAQSTDKQVDEALPSLFSRFKRAEEVAAASTEEIETYIRTVGLYKIKAKHVRKCCIQIMEEFDGQVPASIEGLLTLSGVGRKTATLFLADAYGIPGVTVDTHVFRIARRLGWANGKNPKEVEVELQKVLPEEHWNRINFQLIYHGRTICTARKAKCGDCVLAEWCGKRV